MTATRYQLGDTLGLGGMGEVVSAYDDQIGREVAIKRIRHDDPSDDELARFVREARVQGRLEHPAVVPVHDLGHDADGRPYFVMKRLHGKPMSEVIAALREGEVTDDAATRRRLLHAFADVCLAVELAHSRGIVHRDLKPGNIMLGDFGEVYVLDWGIARALGDDAGDSARHAPLVLATGETRDGTVLGTPAYLAPEQLAGHRAGPLADVYALGCTLFEIVAGEPLNAPERTAADPTPDPRPSHRRPDCPPELDAICARALSPESMRYPSARALGAAVQAYLDGDRDMALRRQLVRTHLQEARAALETEPDTEASRRRAMRAAARALALDPTDEDAAHIVTRLVLEPPAAMPAEVEASIALKDTATARAQGQLAAFSFLLYLLFVPLLVWTGIKDWRVVAAFTAVALASTMHILWLVRYDQIPQSGIYLNACINALLVGIVCRMVGPFIIAPSLAATTLMGYAAHPRFGRIGIIAAIMGSAVAVPWLLELVGAVDRTYSFAHGQLTLRSDVIDFTEGPVQIAFAILLVLLLAVAALFVRVIAQRQRTASNKVELQAWHLSQILPPGARR